MSVVAALMTYPAQVRTVLEPQSFTPVVLKDDMEAYWAARIVGLMPEEYAPCRGASASSPKVLLVSPQFYARVGARTLVNDVCIVLVDCNNASDLDEQLASYFPKEETHDFRSW